MLEPIRFNNALECVEILDQTKLPFQKVYIRCENYGEITHAIKTMQIRGAPAIGIAAAYGVYLGLKNFNGSLEALKFFWEEMFFSLINTRPTAVNLFWALERVRSKLEPVLFDTNEPILERLSKARFIALQEAKKIHHQDQEMCRAIGSYGSALIKDGECWLTHCNAGALATGGYGTALGVFRAAKEQKKKFKVYVDETRPQLQGARLTVFELLEEGIDTILICDNMSAYLMQKGLINGVIVGADRITANGFVANKIGTYLLAISARYHNVPFYVAAPITTFDLSISLPDKITIEERNADEVRKIYNNYITFQNVTVCNPAFDITPPELITAIITNLGIIKHPFKENIQELFSSHKGQKILKEYMYGSEQE